MQYPYDPGILPSSANQCILGKVYLDPIYQGNRNSMQYTLGLNASMVTIICQFWRNDSMSDSARLVLPDV